MAYSGFLLKVNNTEIPLKYIKANSYSCLFSGQDLDSYRDANGELQRNALDTRNLKVEFETVHLMDNDTFQAFLSLIRNNYINKVEKSVMVTAYVPELDRYVTQKCYVPDFTPSVYGVFDGVIKYNSTRIAFIGYGGAEWLQN